VIDRDISFEVPLPGIPPDAPSDVAKELYKERYQKQLDIAQTVEVTRHDTAVALENTRRDKTLEVNNAREDKMVALTEARRDADRTAETALLKAVHDAYIDVTKGSLDRSVSRAQFLTATIGAVSTAYTAFLGVRFAVASNKPAPARGLVPVVFLGLALALAALYVAFLSRRAARRRLLPTGIGGVVAEERLKIFMEWTFAGVAARAWALRTGIVAFAVGIAELPLPFISIPSTTENVVVVVGAAVVLAWGAGEALVWYRQRGTDYIDPGLCPPAD
jgi:hypothetical protein